MFYRLMLLHLFETILKLVLWIGLVSVQIRIQHFRQKQCGSGSGSLVEAVPTSHTLTAIENSDPIHSYTFTRKPN
jgi:hypothetical protein